jgi:hypothetical protein
MMMKPPIAKGCGIPLKGAYNSFCFEFEFRKSHTTKGDAMHKLQHATKC